MTNAFRAGRTARGKFLIVAIGAMLTMQVFAVIVSGVSARSASITGAEQSIARSVDREVVSVVDFTRPAERLVEDTVQLLERQVFNTDDSEMLDYLHARLASTPSISSAYAALPNGEFLTVERHEGGYRTVHIDIGDNGESVNKTAVLDRDFGLLGIDVSTTVTGDAPSTRPWYLAASDASGLIWSDPYIVDGVVGVPVSQAIRANGEVIAVVGVDIELTGLSAGIETRASGTNEATFVVADGVVIAAPTRFDLTSSTSGNDGTELRSPIEFGLAVDGDDGAHQRDAVVSRLSLGSSDGLVAHRHFPITSMADWSLFVRAPESTYTGAANNQQRTTLILTIGGAALLMLAMIAMWRVTDPIDDLEQRASTDPLTGLANRRQIQTTGDSMMQRRRSNEQLAVLALDLDRFKQLNDRLGHHAGDEALQTVARELELVTRHGDLIGRLGGDEFVVAMSVRSADEGIDVAGRVLSSLTEALRTSVPRFELGVTGGLAVSNDEHVDFDDLVTEADSALIRAKIEAKGMMMVADQLVADRVTSAAH